MDLASLLAHQTKKATEPQACSTDNGYDGRLGVRISSIFVILVTSTLGEDICSE